jgi:cytochrome P450
MDMLVALLLIIVPLIFLVLKKWRHRNKKQLPPGPPKLPIIGNLHQLGPLVHRSLWKLSLKYGPVMFLNLGSVPNVVISSAESAEQVLKTHDLDCCSRPRMAGGAKFSYNRLDMAFSPYSDYWREIRKLSTLELLSAKRVRSFRSIREEEVSSLVRSFASSSGHAVDLSRELLKLTANITCRVSFGKSFRDSRFDGDRFQDIVHETFSLFGVLAPSDIFPTFGWIMDRLTGLDWRLDKCFREWDAFLQEVIDDHLNSDKLKKKKDDQGEDIVDVLLRVERDQKESDVLQLTKDHIKAVLLGLFLGGADTSSLTMVWAMAELARNPAVMKKAQDEIRKVVGSKGKVEESEMDQLEYLKKVVKETLRLHPPAVLLVPHETMSHFKLNGYDIEPKTRLQVNVWAIGRDPEIWEEPEEFRPERFDNSTIDYKGQHFELLPFGAGRRVCPGMNMATSVVELTLANLLYAFDWKLPDGIQEIDVEEGAGQTIRKKIPLSLVPVVRHCP